MEFYTKEMAFDWAMKNEQEFTKRGSWWMKGILVKGNHAGRGRVSGIFEVQQRSQWLKHKIGGKNSWKQD